MLAADVLSAVLAFVFGSAAVAKLVRQKQQVLTAEKLRISWRRYRWIGVPEAAEKDTVYESPDVFDPFEKVSPVGCVLGSLAIVKELFSSGDSV